MFSKSDLCKGEGNCVNKGEEHDQHAVCSGWKTAVSVAGSLRAGCDSGWPQAGAALRCSLGKRSPEEDAWVLFIIIFIFFFLSPPSEWRKATALRHAESVLEASGGEPAWGKPIDRAVSAEPRHSVPGSALSPPGRFGCRNLAVGLSAISIPPAQSGTKSCRL